MKIKSNVRAGGVSGVNHIKAGWDPDQHNQTMARSSRVKSGIRAGANSFERSLFAQPLKFGAWLPLWVAICLRNTVTR